MAYRYIESGLDYIWLENGYKFHETPYGEGVSIEDTEGLHRAIGEFLVSVPRPFTGSELRFIRLEMELSQKSLSALIGVEEQAVRRWEKNSGKTFSGPADRLVRAIYDEYLKGEGSVRKMVDRLAHLDEKKPEATLFVDSEDGWRCGKGYVAA